MPRTHQPRVYITQRGGGSSPTPQPDEFIEVGTIAARDALPIGTGADNVGDGTKVRVMDDGNGDEAWFVYDSTVPGYVEIPTPPLAQIIDNDEDTHVNVETTPDADTVVTTINGTVVETNTEILNTVENKTEFNADTQHDGDIEVNKGVKDKDAALGTNNQVFSSIDDAGTQKTVWRSLTNVEQINGANFDADTIVDEDDWIKLIHNVGATDQNITATVLKDGEGVALAGNTFELKSGKSTVVYSKGTDVFVQNIGGANEWQLLTAANPALEPGDYIVNSAGAAFTVVPENTEGEWEFSDSSFTTGTNQVLIGDATQTFTDNAGVQQPGPYTLAKDGAHFKIVNVDGSANFLVVSEPGVTTPPVFVANGGWDATANTPDLTVNTNKTNGSQTYVYLVTTDGTQDIGNGAELFEAGGTVTWFDNSTYRYDPPGKSGYLEDTFANQPAAQPTNIGLIYYATDTATHYVSSGAVWRRLEDLLTTAEITSVTGVDYTAEGVVSAERLDEWGVSRRVQRVFNVSGGFDFEALGYTDKTAVYVRNTDPINGLGVTYGTGGANTLEITHADGTSEVIAALDSFNVQPSEIVFMEKEGTTVRASIIPGERVVMKGNYAIANADGPYPHDAIVQIRGTGDLFFRKTGTNNIAFPADGQANADWWKVSSGDFVNYGTSVEKNALGVVPSNTPFFDTILGKLQRYDTATNAFQVVFGTAHQPYSINWPTNATSGSGINFKVTEDPDATVGVSSISLPDGTQKQIWIVAQQVNGNTPSVGGSGTLGGTAIIRNDGGVVSLVSVPNESRWSNVGSWTTLSYNQLPNLVVDGVDVTDTEIQRILVNVPGAGIWVDIEADTDQASAWSPSTAYVVGDIRSAVEPDTGDSESGRTFNWFRTTAGTSGATFDIAESGDWQRMTVQENHEDWVTVDGDGAGPLYLAAYSTKVRLIGATQTLQLPTPGGINVDRDTVIRNDSPNTWTVLHSGTDTYISGNTAAEAAPNITLESGKTIRIVSGKPDTNSITYNEVGAGGAAGGDLDVMSRSGNNNPGNGNPFQHSEEHLNLGGITYAAGVYTIGTAGNYAIDYGIQQVQNGNTGNVTAGLFVNGTQQGSGVGLSNDNTSNWPFGGSSEISLSLSAGDTVELRQVATPGFGGTNKVTSVSITQIPQNTVTTPGTLPVDQTGIVAGDFYEADGAGGLRKATTSASRIYSNAADQPVPDANVNTYAVDLPTLQVGDTITVALARGTRIYDLTSRYIGDGFVYDHEVKGLEWTTEIVGVQLRLQAVAGGGTQTVKGIFIDR